MKSRPSGFCLLAPGALLQELHRFLASTAADYRARRQPGPQIDAEAAQDIAADLTRSTAACGATAYTAEQLDRQAAATLTHVLADGRVEPAEVPQVRRALRSILRSAEHDHDLTEALTPKA